MDMDLVYNYEFMSFVVVPVLLFILLLIAKILGLPLDK